MYRALAFSYCVQSIKLLKTHHHLTSAWLQHINVIRADHCGSYLWKQNSYIAVAATRPGWRWLWIKFCTIICECVHGAALTYLVEMWIPVAAITGRRCPCSASHGDRWCLVRISTYGQDSFAISEPSVWNDLPPTQTGVLKMWEWKNWHGQNCRAGKCRSGNIGTVLQGWKIQQWKYRHCNVGGGKCRSGKFGMVM